MRIMITGGGTGGHTSPATAVIEELQRRDPRLELQWVGRRGNIEERICRAMAIPFRSIPVEGWPRSRSPRRLLTAAKLALSVVWSLTYLRRFRPQAVFGVGGYVSLPLMYAAQRMGIPTVLHEQNRKLGMANRMLAPRATRVFLSFPETIGDYPRDKAAVVGNPVRGAFLNPPERAAACEKLGLNPALPVVFVFGGSQGAQRLNQAVTTLLPQLDNDELQLLWMTGRGDAAEARKAADAAHVSVQVFAFVEDMVTACAAADLMICRSGASTTAELAVLGKPSVLVPFPFATDNHQEHNARALEEAGGAIVLLDADCSGHVLLDIIRNLLASPERLAEMGSAAATRAKPAAAAVIAEELLGLVFEAVPQ